MEKENNKKLVSGFDDALRSFAEKLVLEKNFEDVDPEVMEQIKQDVYDRLEKHVNAFIMSSFSPEKLEQFDALLEHATEKEIQEFCAENITDLDGKVAQQLVKFRQIYLGV
jgi:hypothetical protein